MTNIFALLLIGATASAERRLDVAGETIAGIVVQVAGGAFNDLLRNQTTDRLGSFGSAGKMLRSSNPRLWIDGQPRTGVISWLAAVNRVAGYALDRETAGSVCLAYRITARGYNIHTTSTYRDGLVRKTVATGWTETVKVLGRTRRIPVHVSFSIRAHEASGGTVRIVGTATGTADTQDFRCRLIRSAADRRAAAVLHDGMRRILLAVEDKSIAWYHAGEFSPEFDRLRTEVGAALRAGRLRR